MTLVTPDQLIQVGERCVKNPPKLLDAVIVQLINPLKKIAEETGMERFEKLAEEATQVKTKSVEPFVENLTDAGKALITLGEKTKEVAKGGR